MLGAVTFGHEAMQAVVPGRYVNWPAEAALTAWDWEAARLLTRSLVAKVGEHATKDGLHGDAYAIADKMQRRDAVADVKAALIDALCDEEDENAPSEGDVSGVPSPSWRKTLVREHILSGNPRIDGRDLTTVRPISVECGLLPRAHGSALFTRGETQAIVATTLGTGRDAQIIDAVTGEYKDPFMLHYNFPPFCVGETGFMGGPKRREIGHGRLARRGVGAVLPDHGELSLRGPRGVRDHRVQRIQFHGLGVRHVAVTDGRRRAGQGAGCGYRDGPDQGRRSLRGAVRHPGRRGSSGRHGLQGRRHRRRASPRCRWTSRSKASTRRS